MSEDGNDQETGRGKKFPATDCGELSNKIVSISALRKLNHSEANDFVSRAVLDHWPQYRIDYYKEVLNRYSRTNSISPQALYDQIMAPEIAARIRDYQARHGITLSVVEARPNPGDNGRDLIRKWLNNPEGKVALGFLKYIRRFIMYREAELRDFMTASATVLESCRRYHSLSLHDISQASFYESSLREILEPSESYCFLLEQEKSISGGRDRKLLTLEFHEGGIGYFLVYSIPNDHTGQEGVCEGIDLEYQGYLWPPQPKLQTPDDEIELHVVFARNFTKTMSMPPCHPYLLSKEIELRLICDSEEVGSPLLPFLRRYLTGGKLKISGELFPKNYLLKPKKISPELLDALKKLEGIQINV